MKSLSMRKWSLLGLVLMAASAVTAAMIPSKSAAKKKLAGNGHIIQNGDPNGGNTCTVNSAATCYDTDTNDAVEGQFTSTTRGEADTSGTTGAANTTEPNDTHAH